jgi:hypothetical protein
MSSLIVRDDLTPALSGAVSHDDATLRGHLCGNGPRYDVDDECPELTPPILDQNILFSLYRKYERKVRWRIGDLSGGRRAGGLVHGKNL